MLAGLILAGGESRRMGRDKALVVLKGRPLIAHVIERLAPQVGALAISANGDAARFAAFALPVLADETPRGPLSGVLAGLIWAESLGARALVTAPCDGPIFPHDLVARLLEAETPQGAIVEGHPTWGLWPTARLQALRAFLASGAPERLRNFAERAGVASWPAGAFVNLNSPKDVAEAEA